MASFSYPPLDPEPDPAPLSPSIPLNPPMVGEASPFDHVDGQNRDLILESIRSWVRNSLLKWTSAWQAYLVYWLALVEAWLNGFMHDATDYINAHSGAGYGWRETATVLATTGTTNVVLALDTNRPTLVGDFVLDGTGSYGQVTVIIDPTHATVLYLGDLDGPPGPDGPPGIAALGEFNVVTGVLAPGAAYRAVMAGQPQMVGAFVVSTDAPAWIRVYASEAYMVADEGRAISTPIAIAADHGTYLDFVSTLGELSKTLTPGVQLTDLGDGVWLSVTNTDPTNPATIAVHFDYRTFRE